MAVATLVSVDEYLTSSYSPDREYIAGQLVERHLGTQKHGFIQAAIAAYLRQFRRQHGIEVFTETRMRINDRGDHRIPDVLVLKTPYTRGNVVVDVPLATIEIKSPDDTFDEILDKCIEYSSLGVLHILVVDPEQRRHFIFKDRSLVLISDVRIETEHGEIPIPLSDMYRELDD